MWLSKWLAKLQVRRHCINSSCTPQLVSLHISFEKGVSSSEDVPADTAGDAPSEAQFADEHAPEDAPEPSAKGVPGTKKDVLPKTVGDGKLVKGMLMWFVVRENIC